MKGAQTNGTNYILACYYSQYFAFIKHIIEKLKTLTPILYKHLLVLEMRELREFYYQVLVSAIQIMNYMDVTAAIATVCAMSATKGRIETVGQVIHKLKQEKLLKLTRVELQFIPVTYLLEYAENALGKPTT